MKNKPIVSVIMSTRNQAEFLEQAMQSVVDQTLEDWELLVVDDASNDDTGRILNKWSKKDIRIRVWRNEERRWLAKNLNFLVEQAQGEYLARMDSDDICLPKRFEVQYNVLKSHPKLMLLGTEVEEIDERGLTLGVSKSSHTWSQLRNEVMERNPLYHSSWMMRKNWFLELGGYREWFKFSQDYEFLLRIIWKSQIAVTQEKLMKYRRTSSQQRFSYYYQQIGFMVMAKLLGVFYRVRANISGI